MSQAFWRPDLRSDTVTRPTAAMREAMLAAPLGDDVFGDDPAVNALQEKIAGLLGFEAALFVPTGTQSNLCAILSHCQRGDEYIVGQMAHCYRWEGGGAAVFGSVQPQPLNHHSDGTLAPGRDRGLHQARRRALRAHPAAGAGKHPGRQAAALRLRAAGHRAGEKTRPEPPPRRRAAVQRRRGAGRANRQQCAGRSQAHCGCFDSVSVCFSKGLGAPVGSALCGSREFIARAHRIRKMAGGGMRQSGMLAAAASHALDHHVGRLAQDHALAKHLADGLAGIEGLQVETPQTNIVFVDLTGAAREQSAALLKHLGEQGHTGHGPVPPALCHPPGCGRRRRGPRRGRDPAILQSLSASRLDASTLKDHHGHPPSALFHRRRPAAQPHARPGRALHRHPRPALGRARRHGGGAGYHAGCFVHIFAAAAVGVSALMAASATAFTVLKWAGAAYLVYVGLRMLLARAPVAGEPSAMNLAAGEVHASASPVLKPSSSRASGPTRSTPRSRCSSWPLSRSSSRRT
jgi:threonine aldolase